jgi:transposase
MNILDYARIDHVYLLPGYTDMRKGIDGLSYIVSSQMNLDPFSNSLFLFCGRKSSVMKGLYWDKDGFLLMTKRLHSGKFQWPRNETEVQALTSQQLRWLLEGLSIYQKRAISTKVPTRVI